jgi:hypothetical protein
MGSGYRTFTAGEVLTASNVQNFLQDQAVMVFADSTARETAIGTANFEEGMVSYLEDSDTVEVYNGTTWGNIAPTSTQGLTLINTTSFSAVASQSLPASTFTSAYDNYRMVCNLKGSTNIAVLGRLRSSSTDLATSVYRFGGLNVGASVSSVFGTSNNILETSIGITNVSTNFGGFVLDLLNPMIAERKQAFIQGTGRLSFWNNYHIEDAGTYDSFTLLGTNITGTISVYGYNK